MSETNEWSVASAGSVAGEPDAWAVLDSRGTVCVAYTCREAAEAYCEGTFNRLAPLYRQPPDWSFLNDEIATLRKRLRQGYFDSLRLTDAEREAVEWCVEMAMNSATDCVDEIRTLRGLLKRQGCDK